MFPMGKVLLGFVIGAAFLFAPPVWAVFFCYLISIESPIEME